ncbi:MULTISPECIES: hypothetical protein [Marinovum]|nr:MULTISPECIES: hypothetical protein [Marinovum]MDD9743390.1 hypothetical protein [Marinovum sp. PR37]
MTSFEIAVPLMALAVLGVDFLIRKRDTRRLEPACLRHPAK